MEATETLTKPAVQQAGSHAVEFRKQMLNKLLFNFFLLQKVPMALLAGLKIKSVDDNSCTVTVPYRWLNTNPFQSTYFAVLSMAAEMSTGTLALMHLYKSNPPVSTIIIGNEAQYTKKATGLVSFTCEDGLKLKEAVQQAIDTGEPVAFRAKTVGKMNDGTVVAEFYFTWSFKAKK